MSGGLYTIRAGGDVHLAIDEMTYCGLPCPLPGPDPADGHLEMWTCTACWDELNATVAMFEAGEPGLSAAIADAVGRFIDEDADTQKHAKAKRAKAKRAKAKLESKTPEEVLDETLRLDRIQHGIHEQRRTAIEFMRRRLPEVTDPEARERIIAAIAEFDAEEAGLRP
jgi:hypothetical protein